MSHERKNSADGEDLNEKYYLIKIKEGMALRDVPSYLRTDKIYLAAVRENGMALELVPEGKRSEEICLAAVQQNELALEFVPEDKLTEEICLVAVQENWMVLKLIPLNKRTEKIYLAVVRQNGLTLKLVPQNERTEEICLTAIQQNWRALELVPQGRRTKEMCLAAVQRNGMALELVPHDKRTKEICLAAVQQNWTAFEFVPEDERTEEIYLAVVQQNGLMLKQLPQGKRTKGICLAAVQQNGMALEFVPADMRTEEIYLAAVQQNGMALEWVPEDKRSAKICLAAVQQNGMALEFVPADKRTREIYIAAILENFMAFEFVPEDERTKEIYLALVQGNGRSLEWIPENERTKEIYLTAVQQDRTALEFVPEDERTEEIYLALVQQDGLALELIPEDKRTEKICLAAVQNNLDAMQYVPENMDEYIQAFLSSIRHIVVVKEDDRDDVEVLQAMQVYANKEKRKNKTIFVFSAEALDEAMDKLSAINHPHSLEMVLLGHHSVQAASIAGMDAPAVISCLARYPKINKVKLLGCHSAIKAEKGFHKGEQEEFKHEDEAKELEVVPEGYYLAYMKDNPELLDDEKEKSKFSKLLNSYNPVFVFYEKNNQKHMMRFWKNDKGETHTTAKTINDHQYQFYLNHKNAPPNIPQGSIYASLKMDNKKRARLMLDLLGLSGYVSKNDPTYPDYKRKHRSERGWKMKWGEGDEYREYFKADSLMRAILEGVHNNPDISQDLELVGFYGAVHVSKEESGFHGTPHNVYDDDSMILFKFKDKIDRKKLKESREDPKYQGTHKKVKVWVSKS